MAAIKYHHNTSSLKQQKFIFLHFQRPKVQNQFYWDTIKVLAGDPRGEPLPCLFQLLEAASVLWLVVVSFQPLPPWPHILLSLYVFKIFFYVSFMKISVIASRKAQIIQNNISSGVKILKQIFKDFAFRDNIDRFQGLEHEYWLGKGAFFSLPQRVFPVFWENLWRNGIYSFWNIW